jgi:hypothetical protein
VRSIIAEFTPHKQHNENAAGDPNCQSKDIDKTISLMPEEISDSNLKIVTKHVSFLKYMN